MKAFFLGFLGEFASFFWFFWPFSLFLRTPSYFCASCSLVGCHPSTWLVKPGHPSGWVPRPSGLHPFSLISLYSFVMAPRAWSRTIDIECKDFPAGTLSSDVAKWVFEYFITNHPDFKVVSIQQCPGRVARVTFDKDCDSAKDTLEELGEVSINGVQCLVVRPEPPPPRLVNVIVYQYPFEFPNHSVETVLDRFGAVKEVGFQRWTNMPELFTGTRLVRMVVEKEIPRFIFIRGIRCKVWYWDQPLTCDICSKGGHKASACPDKGKCLRCHESGHVARHCPNPWGKAAKDHVPPVVIDPSVVVPAPSGDLSLGLQHVEDLDIGLNGPVELQAPVTSGVGSDDLTLVEAANITEVVMDEGFGQLCGLDSSESALLSKFWTRWCFFWWCGCYSHYSKLWIW